MSKITCTEFEILLADYLDGTLAAGEKAAVEEHRNAFQRALRPATERFSPHQAIEVVRRVLPREGVLAFDVGAHTHQIASQWIAHAPRTFVCAHPCPP